jgi:O-antigen ligase
MTPIEGRINSVTRAQQNSAGMMTQREGLGRFAQRFALLGAGTILFTTPFALYYVFEKPSISQSFYATFASILVCSLVLLLAAGAKHKPRRRSVADLPLAFFASVSLLSALMHAPVMFGLQHFAILFAYVAFYLVVSFAASLRGAKTKLVAIVAVAALVVALYGVVQYFGFDIVGFERRQMLERFHVVSLLGNPAFVTSFLLPAIFICLSLLFISRSVIGKIIGFGGALASIACIFLAASRSGWVSLIVTLGIFMLLARRVGRGRISKRALLALLAAGVVLIVLFGVRNPILKPKYNIFKRVLSTTQIEARLYAWRIAGDMFAAHPLLGIGYGNFDVKFWDYVDAAEKRAPSKLGERVLFAAKGSSPGHAHNEYVEVLAESGALGFAAFIWLISVCLWRPYRQLTMGNSAGSSRQSALTAGLLCAFVAILIDSFFSFPLRLPCSALVFWMLVALLATKEPSGEILRNGGQPARGDS